GGVRPDARAGVPRGGLGGAHERLGRARLQARSGDPRRRGGLAVLRVDRLRSAPEDRDRRQGGEGLSRVLRGAAEGEPGLAGPGARPRSDLRRDRRAESRDVKLERIPWTDPAAPTEAALRGRLEADGFETFSWRDPPGSDYTAHSHDHDESLW